MSKPVRKKEHGIVYPSDMVHISTLPLLLNKKALSAGKKEAISASTQLPQLRALPKKKESDHKVNGFASKFKESNNHQFKKHSFEVILIREGMGNFKDRFFYTKEALQGAVASKLFDGTQCYADHPTEIEEQVQPERSTRDILGYYDKVEYQEADDGTGLLVATLNVANSISLDWAMSLLTNSIDYSTKFRETDLVGLSINASGSASPVGIDDLLSQKLSQSVLAKLNEAKAQGISEINVVNELKDAVSVDLVTKAGAGGKILKMLEMEKSMSKKPVNLKKLFESEEGESHKEDGAADASAMAPGKAKPAAEAAPAPASPATPDHSDEDQDKALFAKMIKQYLGKDDADEQEMEMAKNCLQAHTESGMEPKEAYEAAGQHLKMAMAIGKKMAQCKQAEGESEESESESEAHKEALPPPMAAGPGKKPAKESASVVALSGEVAKLRESVKRYELRDYLDEKCKASGEANSVTKKFREALGTPKSKAHIDETYTLFMKAFKAGSEEVTSDSESFFPEKQNYRESDSGSKGISFKDCVR